MPTKSIIRMNRAKLGLTQEDLGKKVNVSANTIRSWENKLTFPNVHDLILLSVHLEISLDELMNDYQNQTYSLKEE